MIEVGTPVVLKKDLKYGIKGEEMIKGIFTFPKGTAGEVVEIIKGEEGSIFNPTFYNIKIQLIESFSFVAEYIEEEYIERSTRKKSKMEIINKG